MRTTTTEPQDSPPPRQARPRDLPRAALCVAHPGHELRIHHWLEIYRPQTFVLTDGSGHGDHGRLDATRRVLEQTGAIPGAVFGRWTDRDAYRVIVEHRLDEIQDLVLELADALADLGAGLVASDAVEGFNPTHDLCFVLAEAAVAIASRRLGRPIRHFDFPLEAAPDAAGATAGEDGILRFELDPQAWARKLSAAREYEALRGEVDRALESHPSDAFRTEVLSSVVPGCDLAALALGGGEAPSYETHGSRRVADGTYETVLRFHEHWLPLASAIRRWSADA